MKSISLILIICTTVLSDHFIQNDLVKVKDISLPPVSTFSKSCSRCHGEEGSSYGASFADLKETELKKIVEDMMFGPAFLNPDELEIEAMVSYHKALKKKKPFATVLNGKSFSEGKVDTLIIEVSDSTDLKLDNKKIIVFKDMNIRRLVYDPFHIKRVEINLFKNNKSSSLIFPYQLWSK